MTISTVAIFGAGKLGSALARLALHAGYETLLVGSPRQQFLSLIVETTTPGARVASPEDAARAADIAILAVPFGKAGTLPWAEFDGKLVIDAMNFWAPTDGHLPEFEASGLSSSEFVARNNPAARLVKSFSHLGYHDLEIDADADTGHGDAGGRSLDGRRALGLAGDDADDRAAVAAFVASLGFDPVDLGPLAAGRVLEAGHPAFGNPLSRDEFVALVGAPAV